MRDPLTEFHVALVSMPFGQPLRPSLALSQLKANLTTRGILVDTHYLNLKFAEHIGPALYHRVAAGAPEHTDLLGEFLFSSALSTRPNLARAEADRAYVSEILHQTSINRREYPDDKFVRDCLGVRDHVKPFLESAMHDIEWSKYGLVVFVVPFLEQQLSASVAMSIRLTAIGVRTLLGGSGVEGEIALGISRNLVGVDLVCSGEWDYAVPDLVAALSAGRDPSTVCGVFDAAAVRLLPPQDWQVLLSDPEVADPVTELDDLPHPDYRDYFAAYSDSPFAKLSRKPGLVFESSRGCWWGAKHHCTFCGLNQNGLVYRAKSTERVLAELRQACDQHGADFARLEAHDLIMPAPYLRNVVPRLKEAIDEHKMFYEVKANLTSEQVGQLKQAGIDVLQPGLESFSTKILRLMDKGTTMLQNVQLLRAAAEHRVHLVYNLLLGFPGEQPADYAAMATVLPALSHLQPPGWWGSIHVDRFSPYFDEPSRFGITTLRPIASYRHVFPEASEQQLGELAYIFDYEHGTSESPSIADYTAPLRSAIMTWREQHPASVLCHEPLADGRFAIWDTRPGYGPSIRLLTGATREVLELCNRIRSARKISAATGLELVTVRTTLGELERDGLVLGEDDHWLSLTLPLTETAREVAAQADLRPAKTNSAPDHGGLR